MFAPVGNRELLSKMVASSIEKAILSKKFQAGDRLPSEHELCDQFQVSRTAVREALRTLSARGLVVIEKGRGNFVKDISADSVTDPLHLYLRYKSKRDYILEVVHARQIIEPSIAAMAAVNHTADDVGTLNVDIEEFRRCKGDYRELAGLDMRFHLDVAHATQNSLIPLLLDPIYKLLPNIKSTIYQTIGEARSSAAENHQKLLDVIVKRDAGAAHRAMAVHLDLAESHAIRMLELSATKELPLLASIEEKK
jgi:GntR family transcriptional regulator, transcriptional repressor for pyruvate dehydrogenase complex